MMFLWFFVTLFMLFGSTICRLSDQSKICPESEYISPCTCEKRCDNCQAEITCSGLSSLDQLNDVFQRSKDYTFSNFYIVNSTFLYIPSTAFSEKRVRKLYLRNNVMSLLFEKPPPPSNDLVKIEMFDLVLRRGVKWEEFSSFSHLEEFNLMRHELTKIDQRFTDNFPRGLFDLYFSDTNTKKLGDNAFAKMNELSALVVKNTKIKVLKRSMLPSPSKLFSMDFSGNQISSLPDDVFSDMPELQAINLSQTQIKIVSESVFGEIIKQIGVLSMEGNSIDCTCELKWITGIQELPMYTEMVCAKPTALAGKEVKNLKPKNFSHCS